MIEQYKELLSNNNYSKISIYTYLSTLNNFIDFVNRKAGMNIIDPMDYITSQNIDILIDNAIPYNETLGSVNSKLKTFTLIKSMIKNAEIKNYKLQKLAELEKSFTKLVAARNDQINKNFKNPAYEPLELNNLVRTFFTPEVQAKLSTKEKFILSLYLLKPPLRNNYYNITYYTNENDFNRDHDFRAKIFNNILVVSNEILKVDVPEDIIIYLTPYQIDLLKNYKNKEKITNSNQIWFAEQIKIFSFKAFGKSFGPNAYRHLFISSLDLNKYSNEQLYAIAKQMNQKKISTFLSYRKFKPAAAK